MSVFLLRYSANMTRFLERWETVLQDRSKNVWDQMAFNDLVRTNTFEEHKSWWNHTEQYERYSFCCLPLNTNRAAHCLWACVAGSAMVDS